MRSPIGPILVVFGLATVVVLVLLLFQNLGLRSDLEAARGELAELRTSVAGMEGGVSDADLADRLDELETEIRDLLLAGGTDGGGVAPGSDEALADSLDEILGRIEALHDRVDEICDNVPVC